jgi:hypothetical protein
MNESEINKQRAQLLVKARALLNEEYLKNRTDEYEKWQADSNRMWISQGILLPCPSKFVYPTEEEIVVKALELYNKQNLTTTPVSQLPKTGVEMTSSVTAKLAEVSRNVTPVSLPDVPATTPWEQYLAPVIEEKPKEPEYEQVIEPVKSEPVVEYDIVEEEQEEPMTEEEKVEEARRNSNLRMLLAKFITMAKELDAKNQKDEGTPT